MKDDIDTVCSEKSPSYIFRNSSTSIFQGHQYEIIHKPTKIIFRSLKLKKKLKKW